jgi:hypothetical protein
MIIYKVAELRLIAWERFLQVVGGGTFDGLRGEEVVLHLLDGRIELASVLEHGWSFLEDETVRLQAVRLGEGSDVVANATAAVNENNAVVLNALDKLVGRIDLSQGGPVSGIGLHDSADDHLGGRVALKPLPDGGAKTLTEGTVDVVSRVLKIDTRHIVRQNVEDRPLDLKVQANSARDLRARRQGGGERSEAKNAGLDDLKQMRAS